MEEDKLTEAVKELTAEVKQLQSWLGKIANEVRIAGQAVASAAKK